MKNFPLAFRVSSKTSNLFKALMWVLYNSVRVFKILNKALKIRINLWYVRKSFAVFLHTMRPKPMKMPAGEGQRRLLSPLWKHQNENDLFRSALTF